MEYKNLTFFWTFTLFGLISCSQAYDVAKKDSQNLITEEPTDDDDPGVDGGGGSTSGSTTGFDPEVLRTLTDTFSVNPATRSVDILFVIDNSGSMEEEQANLARSFNLFIEDMQNNDLDFQIGVIATDPLRPADTSIPLGTVAWRADEFNGAYEGIDNMGTGSLLSKRGNARVLTRDSLNLFSQFTSNVNIGVKGSGYEMGIQSLINAFSPELSGPGKWNSQLFRDDALLSMIIVSDEDETRKIDEYNQYLHDHPQDKVARLLNFDTAAMALKKNRRGLLRVDAIVSDPNNPCSSAKKDGALYAEVARSYGGSVFNICNQFSSILSALGSSINSQTISTFSLKKKVETLNSIKLNGVDLVLNVSYTFNAATNTVTLIGSALQVASSGGGYLEVTYDTKEK